MDRIVSVEISMSPGSPLGKFDDFAIEPASWELF